MHNRLFSLSLSHTARSKMHLINIHPKDTAPVIGALSHLTGNTKSKIRLIWIPRLMTPRIHFLAIELNPPDESKQDGTGWNIAQLISRNMIIKRQYRNISYVFTGYQSHENNCEVA